MTVTSERQLIPIKEDQDRIMRVGETRVTLDTVVHAFEQGHTIEEIVSHYPALRLADVYSVLAYYLNHQGLLPESSSRSTCLFTAGSSSQKSLGADRGQTRLSQLS